MSSLIDRFAAIVGPANALTSAQDQEPYLVEWRDRYHGVTPMVLRPRTTEEVAAIVRLANESGTPIVPQGGNTGLVGGQIPRETGNEIVVSLARMNTIRAVDAEGSTLIADAGVPLQAIQTAADSADRLFPLSLGSEGTCQIGGNIATNAGGVNVLAYGNMRDLVIGLEVVLADGRIWNGLRTLRKDNTGYDLRALFIGAEGTLGIITGAALKLFPKPRSRATAFIGLPSPHHALRLFNRMRASGSGQVTSFELMPRIGIDLCLAHLDGARDPLGEHHPWYVLAEISSGDDAGRSNAALEDTIAESFEADDVSDAAIAQSDAQGQSFWHLRLGLSEVQRHSGGSIKHDISVPVASVPDFIDQANAAVEAFIPGVRPVPFGHLGDGNIHYNVSQPADWNMTDQKAAFLARWDEMADIVHGIVAEFDGSVSAEHGIGRMKAGLMPHIKSEVELDMMRALKGCLDPKGIMNPGRVLPDA